MGINREGMWAGLKSIMGKGQENQPQGAMPEKLSRNFDQLIKFAEDFMLEFGNYDYNQSMLPPQKRRHEDLVHNMRSIMGELGMTPVSVMNELQAKGVAKNTAFHIFEVLNEKKN